MLENLRLLLTQPLWALVIWGSLALLVLLLLLRRPSTLRLAGDKQGELCISRHALHRLIETCCEQIRGVASARAIVTRRRGRFHTRVRLRMRPNARLDAIHGYLVQEITTIYTQNLGLPDVGPVDVKIVGVAADNSF